MSSTLYPAENGPFESDSTPKKGDEALLKRIRNRWDYHVKAWQDIRDAAEKFMQALGEKGAWSEADIEERKESNRPCIHLDQLTQHTNGLTNEARQTPIAIKVEPAGDGADDETAENRSMRIRAIEYESKADQCRTTAFESAVERGYGVYGLVTKYKSWDSFEQKIQFRAFPNPDAVSWDPDAKERDSSDMKDCFVLSQYTHDDFKRQFKKSATFVDFAKSVEIAPKWCSQESIQVAEYWYIDYKEREIFLVQTPEGQTARMFVDEQKKLGNTISRKSEGEFEGTLNTPEGVQFGIIEFRETQQPYVKQCLTNGVEILEKTDWLGQYIPIFPVLGKERWVSVNRKAKRFIDAYHARAIPGQMLWDYYTSAEAETVSATTKNAYIGYEGQFETETDWENINKVHTAFAEVKPIVDAATGQILPLPRREAYEPPIQALEVGKESARRAIQAALGDYGVSKLDDTYIRSGKAIAALERQGNRSQYHFIDNYKASVEHSGRCCNEILDKVDKPGSRVALRGATGEPKSVTVTDRTYGLTQDAAHTVTITTGESFDSQRQEANTLADTMVASKVPGSEKIMDLIIDLKNLGPIGKKMADRLRPPEFRAEQDPLKLAAENAQLKQILDEAKKKIQEFEAKIPEIQSKERIAAQETRSEEKIAAMEGQFKLAVAGMQEATKKELGALKAQIDILTNQLDVIAAEKQQVAQHTHESSSESKSES